MLSAMLNLMHSHTPTGINRSRSPAAGPAHLRLLASLAVVLTALSQGASAVTLFDQSSAHWNASRFRKAYDGLAIVREQPHGRRPVVDFMLGTSGCRLNAVERDYGYRLLDWMLYAYSLSYESRALVATERNVCKQDARGITVAARPADIRESRSAGMRGYGKTFYWADPSQSVSSYPMRRLRPMERKAFTARLVPLGDETNALALARKLAPEGRALVYEGFIIIGTRAHSKTDLRSVGQTLTRFLRFLVNTYGMAAPEYYLRVHLMASPSDLRKLADRLHGLDVSPATIGYTFVEDAAVIGYVPKTAAGTILHELFHLMVRRNFGDVPQWLDEGMAALYEVSGRQGDRYFGLDNWRRRVLESVWYVRPTLRELIRAEWFLFDDPRQVKAFREQADREGYHDQQEGSRQAAMMAVARYFAMYLEQRGQLVKVYSTIRDRGFVMENSADRGSEPASKHSAERNRKLAQFEGDARDRAVWLVEDAVDMASIEEVDRDFVAWFQAGAQPTRRPMVEGGSPYVATANVNVRTGPGTGHTRLMTVTQGTPVAVYAEEAGWYRIRMTDETTGYIKAEFLEPIDRVGKALPNQ